MMRSLGHSRSKFYRLFQRTLPFWLTLLFIILSLMPWQISFIVHFTVPLAYVSIFYWIIFRDKLMSPFTVFVLGLSADLLTNVHLGYNTLLFLLFYEVVFKNRHFLFGRSFLFLWLCFGVCCIGLSVTQWVLTSLLLLSWTSLWFFVTQELLLFMLFPFVMLICASCSTRVLEEI